MGIYVPKSEVHYLYERPSPASSSRIVDETTPHTIKSDHPSLSSKEFPSVQSVKHGNTGRYGTERYWQDESGIGWIIQTKSVVIPTTNRERRPVPTRERYVVDFLELGPPVTKYCQVATTSMFHMHAVGFSSRLSTSRQHNQGQLW